MDVAANLLLITPVVYLATAGCLLATLAMCAGLAAGLGHEGQTEVIWVTLPLPQRYALAAALAIPVVSVGLSPLLTSTRTLLVCYAEADHHGGTTPLVFRAHDTHDLKRRRTTSSAGATPSSSSRSRVRATSAAAGGAKRRRCASRLTSTPRLSSVSEASATLRDTRRRRSVACWRERVRNANGRPGRALFRVG